ncbi:unnamed protein product [Prorocentrum cordatum]|uniref:Uncharacterized protein n=1 Tax=Prorocentrum cordatum TaxID=2364126 RepID=A0ABN9TLH6_9DINO|nr:unnamed protein product [Polarella glacialis]
MAPIDESLDRPLDEFIEESSLGFRPVRSGRAQQRRPAPYAGGVAPPPARGAGARGGLAGRGGSAGQGSSAGRGGKHARLVAEIKDWQRASLKATGAWQDHCDRHGDGSYDPALYDQEFLEAALAALRGGRAGPAAARKGASKGEGPLTDKVKEWQRASIANTQAWRSYCIEVGDGTYDPAQYDAAFLKVAMADLGMEAPGHGGKGVGRKGAPAEWGPDAPSYGGARGSRAAGGGKGGKDGGQLTEEVKTWQRASLENTRVWRQHCEERGDGSYDPSAYSGAFLRAFLAEVAEGGGGAPRRQQARAPRGPGPRWQGASGGRGPLTDQVKELQRVDRGFSEAWRRYCDECGDGVYDPSKHDGAFLKAALRSLGGD